MGVKMMFDKVKPLDSGVWAVDVPPYQVQVLGQPKLAQGKRSIIFVRKPEYSAERFELVFDLDSAIVVNLGASPDALIVDLELADLSQNSSDLISPPKVEQPAIGSGDKSFLALVSSELHGAPKEASYLLLKKIREFSPGDLKRGERNNFSNTPDNFWYVIVQPRVQALSITVRGNPSKFQPSPLNPIDDRPGYTRFKVYNLQDVEEAIRIIKLSTRKY